jgi:predicted aspartyl protease
MPRHPRRRALTIAAQIMISPRWFLLLALLAGCAAPAGPGDCEIHKAAEIPLGSERGFITAPARLDGKPVTLLIDTGAEGTMVTPTAVTTLSLHADRHRTSIIHGTTGTITSRNVLLDSVEIGGMETPDRSVAVGALSSRPGATITAAGLLGADWLRDFEVELDLPHRRMAFYRATGCTKVVPPWPGRTSEVAVQLYGAGIVILPVELNGKTVTALLDSGANISVMKAAAAERIGIGAAELAADRPSHANGVGGSPIETRRHRFEHSRIGEANYTNAVVAIGAVNFPIADMLLGADWLSHTKVWISYAKRRIFIQPPAWEAAGTAAAAAHDKAEP